MPLESIVLQVQRRLAERRQARPLGQVERAAAAAAPARGFARALRAASGGMALIAELKKASPSAGVLRRDFEVAALAATLADAGADALSVLTESDHFQGALGFLAAAGATGLPRLQKDFIVDEYQVWEGRAAGADAVLLIAALLEPARSRVLAQLALDLGMDVLFEAHSGSEVERVAAAAAQAPERILVGINNRDLHTFTVSLQRSLESLPQLAPGLFAVSESGIQTPADVQRLHAAGARGILVGELLMRATDPAAAARDLLREVRRG